MNYNFEEDYINYEFDATPNQAVHFPNPCDFIGDGNETDRHPRTSIGAIQRD